MRIIGGDQTPPVTPQFRLISQDSIEVTEHSFHGLWLIVYFGYTHCPTICPRTLTKLTRVFDALEPHELPMQGLFITIDPERDTPARLRSTLTQSAPRFLGLTGTSEAAVAARDSFAVFARRRPTPITIGGSVTYEIAHTAFTYLIAPDGRYVQHWTDTASSTTIATDIISAAAERNSHVNDA